MALAPDPTGTLVAATDRAPKRRRPFGTATYWPLCQFQEFPAIPVYRQWPGCQTVGEALAGGGGTSSDIGGGGGIGAVGTTVAGCG